MSKITVTTIAGQTSGSDANKVKIESGDTLEVVSGTASINNTSNGTLASFKKSGTTIGHIGVHDDDGFFFTRGASQQGIVLKNSSLMPCNTDGSNSDNDQDLGISSVRWKDLYLSGGLKIGGTGAANTLDDYEEGTWQPNFTNMNSGATNGTYTKVGNLVICNFELQANGSNTNVNVTGVPFAILVGSGVRAGGVVTYHNRNTTETWTVIPISSSAFNLYHGAASRTITSSETVIGTFSFFTTA